MIDVNLLSYIELIFRSGLSCLPAALLYYLFHDVAQIDKMKFI